MAGDEQYQAWWARYLRAAASPSMGRGALGLNAELDIRHLLAEVDVPTLVIDRTNEQWVDVWNSRYLAAHIAGARLIEASGVDHRPWLGDAGEILDAIETFLTGTSARPRARRETATGAEALSRREGEICRPRDGRGERACHRRGAVHQRAHGGEPDPARAYAKLGVRSRLELARRSGEFGLGSDFVVVRPELPYGYGCWRIGLSVAS